jgi:hypothetical protein
MRRKVACTSYISGRSGRGHCWKQATTHHRRAPATWINILVDKIVDDHVKKSENPPIIDDLKLFASILGKGINE